MPLTRAPRRATLTAVFVHRLASAAIAVAPLTIALTACSCASYPERVRITVVDATIAPYRANGEAWDGFGRAPLSLVQTLGRVLAPPGRPPEGPALGAAVATLLAEAALSGLEAPDPGGWAELYAGGFPRRLALPTRNNTLRPLWDRVEWVGVPFRRDLRMRLSLEDVDDFSANEAVGIVELGYDDLARAYESGQIYQVRLAERSSNQWLFVGVSVAADGS
ncbi:MAG: hypothetical protein MUF34_38020 [Polyangiaceae bacterium]|nr:hypothetical protein [Polyangiaceae bacterium]